MAEEIDALERLKADVLATWSAGNYETVARTTDEVAVDLVDRLGIQTGELVLDVACGTGNAAIAAARHGGRAVGLDIAPALLAAAARRAAEAALDIEWVEGDAEGLPYPDGAFDVVVSTFGVMFAPRHAIAAAEMARVLRGGGRVGLASWTPEGSVGRLLATIDRYLPGRPPGAGEPLAWGDERHVKSLFAGSGFSLTLARRRLRPSRPNVDIERATAFYLGAFGPIVAARRALQRDARWASLESELRPAIAELITDPGEYLVVTGTKAG